MPVVDGYVYEQESGLFARGNPVLIKECTTLYSEHYGVWNEPNKLIKKPVVMPASKLRKWLHDNTVVATAKLGNELIAYAIA